MAEPTGAYKFEDLMTLVATEIGSAFYGTDGDEEAMVPIVDRHDFLLVKGIVNRGVKLFQNTPPVSSGWNWRRKVLDITLIPGTHNYLLDQDFGGTPAGPLHYAADTAHSSQLTLVHESRIKHNRSVNVTTGYPSLVAIVPSNTSRRFEAIFDPSPSAADIVELRYISHFDQLEMEGGTATGGSETTLVDTSIAGYKSYADDYFNDWVITVLSGTGKGETATVTDWVKSTSTFTFTALSGGSTPDTTTIYMVQPAANLHPAGATYDTAILHACYAQMEMEVSHIEAGWEGRFYNVFLPAAFETNRQQLGRSRRLGRMSNGPVHSRERTWSEITYE